MGKTSVKASKQTPAQIEKAELLGRLSIAAGVAAIVSILSGMLVLILAPAGIILGTIAINRKQARLGWIGIGISALAILIVLILIWDLGNDLD